MNRVTSGVRGLGTAKIATLFGTASFVTMAGLTGANAQPLEVLITGSLIAGAPSVGVPVTNVGEEQFLETGAITASEMLRGVPAIDVDASLTGLRGGGSTGYGQNVAIHGFEGSGGDATTLLLINGRRWPVQGHGGDTVDPSIIPQLAVERIDILTAGASAVYGSDAVTGVLNVILKRNFEGAISQVTYSQPVHVGQGVKVSASHLHGVSWDTGNVTLTGEAYFQQRVQASAFPDMYTANFEPWGLPDRNPLGAQSPGVISWLAANNTGQNLGRWYNVDTNTFSQANNKPAGDEWVAAPFFNASYGSGTGTPTFYEEVYYNFATGEFVTGPGEDVYTINHNTLPSGLGPTTGTRFCMNCYYIPHGAGQNWGTYDGITYADYGRLNWANDILPNQFQVGQRNEDNQRNGYDDAWATPQQQREAFVGTLNQRLTNDFFGLGEVELHGTTFYSNRKGTMHFAFTPNSGNSREYLNLRQGNGFRVPTINPFRPIGMPANALVQMQVSQLFGDDDASRINFENIATRYEFGLNFNSLPFDWVGDMFYSMSNEQNNTHTSRMINVNHALAALGHTITSNVPSGFTSYTKPAGIPYLNVFCDGAVWSQCNSPDTLDYILGYRNQNNQWRIRQMGVNFSGPLYTLPSGDIMAAVSFEHVSQHFWFTDVANAQTTFRKGAPSFARNDAKRISHAFFGQLNIPLIGGAWAFPGMEALDLELGYRVDKYDFLDEYVRTPKIAANWTVGWGLTLRGAWGKSFRAPSFGQNSSASGSRAIPYNLNVNNPDMIFNCDGGNTPAANSATAILNPLCNGSGAYPAFANWNPNGTGLTATPRGIRLDGGSGLGDFARGLSPNLRVDGRQKGLNPESAKQYVLGFNFAPQDGFLSGLMLDVSYFNIRIDDTIRNDASGNSDPDNPLSRGTFVIRPFPNLSIFDPANAEFLAVIEGLASLGTGTSTFAGDLPYEQIMFVQDNANANTGFIEYSGIDFDSRYDIDFGNWGTWHIGAAGYYAVDQVSKGSDLAPEESLYEDNDSGAQMKRMRTRIGWTNGTWSATLFNLFRGHQPPTGNIVLPDCYWNPQAADYLGNNFGPNNTCFAGAEFFPQPTDQFADGPPGHSEFDLNISYNTGLMPTNTYLQNLNISLTINNVLDRDPPFNYEARSGAREVRAYDARWSEYGRFVSLSVTKTW